MESLKDYKLTDVIKFKKYFKQLREEIYEGLVPEMPLSTDDNKRIELIDENISFLDSYIVRTFQVIKFDTKLPSWFSNDDELKKRYDDMAKFNSEMIG